MFSFTKLITLLILSTSIAAASSPTPSGHRSRKAAKKFDNNGIGAHFISVGTMSSPTVPTAVAASPSTNNAASAPTSSSESPAASPNAAPAAPASGGSYGGGY